MEQNGFFNQVFYADILRILPSSVRGKSIPDSLRFLNASRRGYESKAGIHGPSLFQDRFK